MSVAGAIPGVRAIKTNSATSTRRSRRSYHGDGGLRLAQTVSQLLLCDASFLPSEHQNLQEVFVLLGVKSSQRQRAKGSVRFILEPATGYLITGFMAVWRYTTYCLPYVRASSSAH